MAPTVARRYRQIIRATAQAPLLLAANSFLVLAAIRAVGTVGDGDVERRAPTRRTRDAHPAAQHFNAVLESDEPGALPRVRPADAVVRNHEVQVFFYDVGPDVHL